MKLAIFDIEGNNLYDGCTKLHCAWLYDVSNDSYHGYDPYEIHWLLDDLCYYDVVIGHNINDFDIPVLEKLYNQEYSGIMFDTLTAARFLNPDMVGGHALKQWGKRLKVLKGDYGEQDEDATGESVWETFDWGMYWYCKEDVEVTLALFNHLVSKGLDPRKLDLNPINLSEITYD